MIPLIPIVGPWLVKRLLASKPGRTDQRAEFLAKAIQIVAVLALLVAGWLVFDHLNDRAAVRRHEAERVEQALQAERDASANDAARRAAASAQSRATEAELETIHAQDPEAAAAPAAPGSRAVAGRLPAR